MRKYSAIRIMVILLIVLPFLFSACIKDECKQVHTYFWFEPVYKSKAEVRANIKSNAPKAVSNPGKLFIRGNYIFLNEVNKGIHIIDNSNPSHPRNVAFIDIPGNLDMAVKGNTLYADMFTDMLTLDISDPLHIQIKKITDGIFPYRSYGWGFIPAGGDNVLVDWIKKDTVITQSCKNTGWVFTGRADVLFMGSSASASPGIGVPSQTGAGGSMARFTIMDNHLYTVGISSLDAFNITDQHNPVNTDHINIGWNIETIYPFRNKLFIGSMTGMFIYDVTNPGKPVASGQFTHVSSCDPVIADDNYAYVTLRSGTACMGFTNELQVLQLSSFPDPVLLKKYSMTNPHGLSKDGNLLFICDGSAGLKIYNSSNVSDLRLVKHVKGIDTYDVITLNKVALVVAKDGLYQYDYSDINNIKLLSRISVVKS